MKISLKPEIAERNRHSASVSETNSEINQANTFSQFFAHAANNIYVQVRFEKESLPHLDAKQAESNNESKYAQPVFP